MKYYILLLLFYYFPLILFIGLKDISSCPVFVCFVFKYFKDIYSYYILLFCTRYMFYSNLIVLYLIFYNVYKSLYEEKRIFEGTST